ncbi:hypothetical protein BDR07DRAFT_673126 [Suillus spraguei]|nr:hypothetical protein BDR07DRAFT_673126 [Suillus spraguei]
MRSGQAESFFLSQRCLDLYRHYINQGFSTWLALAVQTDALSASHQLHDGDRRFYTHHSGKTIWCESLITEAESEKVRTKRYGARGWGAGIVVDIEICACTRIERELSECLLWRFIFGLVCRYNLPYSIYNGIQLFLCKCFATNIYGEPLD